MEYDWPTVLVSLLAAVAASAIALYVVSRKTMGTYRAILGGLFMGGAIAGMHYIGMVAMRLPAICYYNDSIVAVSIALAIAASLPQCGYVPISRGKAIGRMAKAAGGASDGSGHTPETTPEWRPPHLFHPPR